MGYVNGAPKDSKAVGLLRKSGTALSYALTCCGIIRFLSVTQSGA